MTNDKYNKTMWIFIFYRFIYTVKCKTFRFNGFLNMDIDTKKRKKSVNVVKVLKEGIISLSLHKIRRKCNNLIYITVPFYNQNGEFSVDFNGVNC